MVGMEYFSEQNVNRQRASISGLFALISKITFEVIFNTALTFLTVPPSPIRPCCIAHDFEMHVILH